MLFRPTPLQQPTGPLQPCLRALRVSARPLHMSGRPLLVSAPWMPDVPRLLSLSPVLLCQRERLPSTRIKTGGGRKFTYPGIMQENRGCGYAPLRDNSPDRSSFGPARCAR